MCTGTTFDMIVRIWNDMAKRRGYTGEIKIVDGYVVCIEKGSAKPCSSEWLGGLLYNDKTT